ncbi:MAG: PD40 domain-containing protein [Deltaproteobacteria bacterium]|nr:PD40 domain-containing protein [Deltaproteobacteria bacterium]
MRTLITYLFFIFAAPAFAQSVVLKQAKDAAVPIAIQAFLKPADNNEATKIATDLEADLTADLIFSRVFKVLPADSFLESTITGPIQTVKVDSWRQVGALYLVRAKLLMEGKNPALEAYVFDITTGKTLIQKTYRTKRSDHSLLAHQFGDDIVEIVTGKKGLFSTKIAFSYQKPGTRGKEIWVMDFNGRNARPLVQNGRTNLGPTWSVDGRYIYYTSSSTIHWNIWKTDLNGKNSQVTNFRGSALRPAMMPNGREMVASLSVDGNPDIYLLSTDGQIKKRLTKRQGINVSPNPSPDGSKICFSSDRLGNLHVFTYNFKNEEVTRLTRVGTLNDACAWNPTENLILFSGMDTDRDFDIFAMNDQGNDMERLTYDAKNNEAPSWSPDGKLIAFSSRRTGNYQIYVMKADGTRVDPLVKLNGEASYPAWSPRLGY